MAEPAILERFRSSSSVGVRPVSGVYSKVYGEPRESQEWPVRFSRSRRERYEGSHYESVAYAKLGKE